MDTTPGTTQESSTIDNPPRTLSPTTTYPTLPVTTYRPHYYTFSSTSTNTERVSYTEPPYRHTMSTSSSQMPMCQILLQAEQRELDEDQMSYTGSSQLTPRKFTYRPLSASATGNLHREQTPHNAIVTPLSNGKRVVQTQRKMTHYTTSHVQNHRRHSLLSDPPSLQDQHPQPERSIHT